jgi:hypothetical protein
MPAHLKPSVARATARSFEHRNIRGTKPHSLTNVAYRVPCYWFQVDEGNIHLKII